MEGDYDPIPVTSRFNRYRLLLRYAIPARGLLASIAVLTLVVSLLAILEPWPMKLLVDNVLSSKPLTGASATISAFLPGANTRSGLLAWVALAGLILFALGTALDVILTEAWVRAGQRTTYGLAADVFGKLQRRSLAFHGGTSVGDSMTRVMSDSWCVNTLVDGLLFKPALALVTGTGILVIMARMDSRLTLLSLLVLPPMVAASMMTGPRIRKASKARRAAQVQVNSHLQQALSGVSVIKAFGQEEIESARFGELADASIRSEQRASLTMQLNTLASGMVSTVGVGGVLWVGAHDVMAGRLTLGGLLVFVTYLKTLQGRLRALAGVYSTLQSVDASVDRVVSALAEAEVSERHDASSIGRSRGHVRLEGVTFGYEADRPVLRDISLEAHAGETVAIVGATGAGKSTLVALVCRLMDPWNGRVLLDGQDIRELRIDDVRRQFAWVPQETFLVPGSIADNIAYGCPGATRYEVEKAAIAATADGFIERLPDGFDTRLEERGMTLSGGERQRLAIARAMILDAPILILDEPTSALDAETEEQLQNALRHLGQEKTVFVIAHRLATIRRATRVIVLDRGRVVEEGTHTDLLRKNGAYARMNARVRGEPRMKAGVAGNSGIPA